MIASKATNVTILTGSALNTRTGGGALQASIGASPQKKTTNPTVPYKATMVDAHATIVDKVEEVRGCKLEWIRTDARSNLFSALKYRR
jgi:hypothetical protein